MKFPIFPAEASTTAHQVDLLYFALLILSATFLLIIFGPMAYFLVKYRRGKKADRSPLKVPTLRFELAWTLIPFVLMMGVFAWAGNVYYGMEHIPPDALEVNVVGKQWMWKIQHAEGNREINELHVPIGRTIKLNLASQDVIHSFYLPAFRIKKDVVPGRYSTEWFRATKIGAYRIFCAEYCGKDHSQMIGHVVVMEPAEYDRWLSQGTPGDTLAQSGERLFRELGCSGCHEGSPRIRAPRLEGLYGKAVPLEGGTIVTADDKYIRDSILLPQSQITAGYEPLMPTYQGRVSEDELMELIAYIKSLGRAPHAKP